MMRTIKDEILQDENIQHWMAEINAVVLTRHDDHVENALQHLIERVIEICKTDEWARGILEEQAKEQKPMYRCSVCGEVDISDICANGCGFGDTMIEQEG